ncbi:TraR/DksA C4-type zinc finger protein [Quatrionicoccus australiensis]
MCGEPIPQARREAQPGTQTCIECQRDIERLGLGTPGVAK